MTRMPAGYDAWKTRSDLDEWYRYHPGEEPGEEPCPNCEGAGCSSCEPEPDPCEACGGEGRIYRTRSGSPSDPDVIDCGPCVYCDAGIVAPKPKKPREPPPPPIDDSVPF